ncbi:MAG: flagellar hook-associated protein 3, partial [Pseudobdellovibrionaceae bacterium]
FTNQGDYQGDNGEMKIQTHKESFLSMNIPGNKVFHGVGLSGDRTAQSEIDTPLNVEELNQWRNERNQLKQEQEIKNDNFVQTRGLASEQKRSKLSVIDPVDSSAGINVFQTLRDLEVSLKTNDKQGIFTALDDLDASIAQVILARAEVGSRIMSVNGTTDSIQKAIVDNKVAASQLEDVDVFQVVSEINKTDAALKATLETSGRMIQPSLMDFVK